MVLKRLFISDPGEDSLCTLSLFRSPWRQSLWADSFIWKMVLKRPLIIDPVEDSTLIVQIFSETVLIQLIQSFYSKDVLDKRPFVSDTREASACSFRSPRRLNISSWYNSVTEKMVLKRPFVGDTGEASACSFLGMQGGRTKSIWEAFLEDGLLKGIYHWHREASACLIRCCRRQGFKLVTLGKLCTFHCSGVLRDRAHQHDRFTWNIVL